VNNTIFLLFINCVIWDSCGCVTDRSVQLKSRSTDCRTQLPSVDLVTGVSSIHGSRCCSITVVLYGRGPHCCPVVCANQSSCQPGAIHCQHSLRLVRPIAVSKLHLMNLTSVVDPWFQNLVVLSNHFHLHTRQLTLKSVVSSPAQLNRWYAYPTALKALYCHHR
jgi:hypothetical protein